MSSVLYFKGDSIKIVFNFCSEMMDGYTTFDEGEGKISRRLFLSSLGIFLFALWEG